VVRPFDALVEACLLLPATPRAMPKERASRDAVESPTWLSRLSPHFRGTLQPTGAITMNTQSLLKIALIVFGIAFLLIYPLSVVWPSGWSWHMGAPYTSDYFMMIVGVYAVLGVFLILAARDPLANRSLIWFTVASSAVHAAIMTEQSFTMSNGMDHMGHLVGDVPALFGVTVILGGLLLRAENSAA
jgi:hypothetical protein